MFANDTNLFLKLKRIKVIFSTVNRELQNINGWFISKKLSLNVKKKRHFQNLQKLADITKTFH